MRKEFYIVIFFLLVFVVSPLGINRQNMVQGAAGTCTWDLTDAEPGEVITISYDASGGPLTGKADVEILWYMEVYPNKLGAPPSQDMWPENTTLLAPISPREAISPMISTEADQWEIQFTLNRVFDSLVIYFKSGSNYDRNDFNYWIIDSAIKNERIEAFSPAYISPLFVTPSETYHFYVNASSGASSWQIQITDKTETPINLNPTATYDSNAKWWDLKVAIPDNLEYTLYDLKYSATIDSKTRFKEESNSLAVIEGFKENYTFIVFSDPQHFRDGSYSENRNLQHGEGNVSVIAEEIDLINPEFILFLGDVVEWTDEIAYANAKHWYTTYLDVPMFIIPGNHDTFQGTGNDYEYGSGIGVYQRYFGPRHFAFSYGQHYFVGGYSADREMDPASSSPGPERETAQIEWNFIQDTLNNAPNDATLKFFMLHHPLSPNYATSDSTVDLRDDILNLLDSNSFDYYLHGHMHSDWYDVYNGITHIGTNNAVGDPAGEFDGSVGYRVIEMEGDIMKRFSYGPVDAVNYYAASNPPHMVNVTFEYPNDGTVSNNTAFLYNGFNHSLDTARLRFAMAPPPSGKTYETNSTDIAMFCENGIFYIDAVIDIAKETNTTIIITQVDAPEEPTTTTTPAITTTTTTEVDTSTLTTVITSEETTGMEIFLFLSTLMAITLIRRKIRN